MDARLVLTESERAALELTDGSGVSDEAWASAVKHFDDDQLAALVCLISLINTYHRLDVITRQPAGDYQPSHRG
jgi:hypothetical protein